MDTRALIAQIRRHETPLAEDLQKFAAGLANGAVSDAQAGAFAMAVCLNGLSDTGRTALTEAMRDSGDVMAWQLPGPVLDKHSTGGIGDCVSLVLAPALAACGVYVPMISGRGLGHTGGTLDKLEAIPGLHVDLEEHQLRDIVRRTGCAIVGATGQIAPADRRLYAIRDVTSTVESVDLITASILSKKLAAGLDGLVLDVKLGSGAFMKTANEAQQLARALVDAANGAGCKTTALITDMNAPLAPAIGNAVEVAVCMEVLAGNLQAAPRFCELVIALGTELLTDTHGGAAEESLRNALASGQAMERFAAMVSAMGGPPDIAEDWRTHLPLAPVVGDITAPLSGVIQAVDGQALGMVVVALGGGRRVETDRVNPAVGLSDVVPLGTPVNKGDPLCTLHAQSEDAAEQAAQAVRAAFVIAEPPPTAPLVIERVV